MDENLDYPQTCPALLAPLHYQNAKIAKAVVQQANPRGDGVIQMKTVNGSTRIGLAAGYVPLTVDLIISGVVTTAQILINTGNQGGS